jgi:very-short-patch-repair endonuclease
MQFAQVNKNQLITSYIDAQKSIREISEELKVSQSKVRRALIFLGVKIRTWSESQTIAISRGITSHPTKGKKLSRKTREKISVKNSDNWASMTPEKMEEIRGIHRKRWADMPTEQKENLRELAGKAIRDSAKHGSKTERFIVSELEKQGYGVIIHARNLVQSTALEVDIFIPELRTAIEIDGPSHFVPIWGAEKLSKQMRADTEKQGLLINSGYVLIRVKQMDKSLSAKKLRDVLTIINEQLEIVKDKFPDKNHRLVEIEVKDGRSTKQF